MKKGFFNKNTIAIKQETDKNFQNQTKSFEMIKHNSNRKEIRSLKYSNPFANYFKISQNLRKISYLENANNDKQQKQKGSNSPTFSEGIIY